MTANDFFKACKLGYKAIGKKIDGFTPVQLYLNTVIQTFAHLRIEEKISL